MKPRKCFDICGCQEVALCIKWKGSKGGIPNLVHRHVQLECQLMPCVREAMSRKRWHFYFVYLVLVIARLAAKERKPGLCSGDVPRTLTVLSWQWVFLIQTALSLKAFITWRSYLYICIKSISFNWKYIENNTGSLGKTTTLSNVQKKWQWRSDLLQTFDTFQTQGGPSVPCV